MRYLLAALILCLASRAMAEPKMIEIRPGYWVSSYGCVTEDNFGRKTSCDQLGLGDGGGGGGGQ